MASNPCLTFLLVFSALVSIALVITSALLATAHTTVLCSGDGEEVVVNHYAVVDNSQEEFDEGKEEPCNCHCNCETEEMITVVKVFILDGRFA